MKISEAQKVQEYQGKNLRISYMSQKQFKSFDFNLTSFVIFSNRCCRSMFANRISYFLNAKGPSISLDQACCSSLVALEQAHQAILRGECESAIVGGSYIAFHPQTSFHYSRYYHKCIFRIKRKLLCFFKIYSFVEKAYLL